LDIQHLVDRLEDLIDEGRHIPFSKYTMIDEERALEIIDQMRISIPEEIEKAARVLSQRDRVLAQANEEAARIVQQARERSDQMVEREASVQAAQSRAANLIEQARQETEGITGDADRYVLEVLSKLEQFLLREINVVRNGINEVNQPVGAPEVRATMPPSQTQPAMLPVQRQPVEVGARHESDK
jgi:cell division septum initiation protein DivIVA